MNVKEFTITGRVPSKKNSRNIFVSKNGRRMNIPSKKYLEWHAVATEQINKQFFCVGKADEVQMDWYMPDNRRCDLTNKAESIMDLLVDTGIIEDDCWQYIPRIMLDARGVDKKNPRVIIWIKYND